MRLYSFTNYYLSDIQRGIQTGHCISEMSVNTTGRWFCDYLEWAKNYKTMVLLNGGNSKSLNELISFLSVNEDLYLHWDFFNEDEQSLNGALTAVGVIVPEYIYAIDLTKYPTFESYDVGMCFDEPDELFLKANEIQFTFAKMLSCYKLA